MVKLQNANTITFLGEELEIEFSDKSFLKPRVLRNGNKLVVFRGDSNNKSPRAILHEYLVKVAADHIVNRVKEISKQFNFEFRRISIKDTSSRWGSCSSQKNLNFNWRLAFAPVKVLDYVVVHELSHTVEMNHSSRFWDLVAKVMPDYKLSEVWLKRNGREIDME